jgi:cyclic-di-GMP phosphodiesterase TipF (flagellum assembly factor)
MVSNQKSAAKTMRSCFKIKQRLMTALKWRGYQNGQGYGAMQAFVTFMMAVIAAAFAATLTKLVDISAATGVATGVAAFFALTMLEILRLKRREGRYMQHELAILRDRMEGAEQDLEMMRSRIIAQDKQVSQRIDEAIEPCLTEIQTLGVLLTGITEAVTEVDRRVSEVETLPASHQLSWQGQSEEQGTSAANESDASQGSRAQASDGLEGIGSRYDVKQTSPKPDPAKKAMIQALLEDVRHAIGEGHIDLALQSIVQLPQRRVRFYECYARLNLRTGKVLEAKEAVPVAEAANLAAQFDAEVISQAVMIARRLASRNPKTCLFVNLSRAALSEASFFDKLIELLEGNSDLAPNLVFEFRQEDVREFSAVDIEGAAAIRECGFRFSLDTMHDMRMDFADLAEAGFRYIKIPIDMLLDPAPSQMGDIHPMDLSTLVARHGIDLVIERVETEAQIIDALEYNAPFGQGLLFSTPKVVRQSSLGPRVKVSDMPPANDKKDTDFDKPMRKVAGGKVV